MDVQKRKTIIITTLTLSCAVLVVLAVVVPDLTRSSPAQDIVMRWSFFVLLAPAILVLLQMPRWQFRTIVKAAIILFFILALVVTSIWAIFIRYGS